MSRASPRTERPPPTTASGAHRSRDIGFPGDESYLRLFRRYRYDGGAAATLRRANLYEGGGSAIGDSIVLLPHAHGNQGAESPQAEHTGPDGGGENQPGYVLLEIIPVIAAFIDVSEEVEPRLVVWGSEARRTVSSVFRSCVALTACYFTTFDKGMVLGEKGMGGGQGWTERITETQ